MKNYKKLAFTLAEVLIALVIVGIIAVVCIKNFKFDTMKDKEYISKVNKVIETFDQALSQLRDTDKVHCPMGIFLSQNKVSIDGTYSPKKEINVASSSDILNLLKDYIKFDSTDFNFCTYSGYCDASTTNHPGGKISGDIYVGIELYDNIAPCPNYYTPEGDLITVKNNIKTGAPKCWANLLIDVNGTDGPNTNGTDVFVYGIDAYGVHH